MHLPPTLSTARLTLLPLSMAHSEGMFGRWSDADVCRYSGDAQSWSGKRIALPARTRADSDHKIDFFIRRAAAGAGFRWAMIEKTTERFVGAVGFNHLAPAAEVANHLTPAARGYGYAREGLAEALLWAVNFGAREVEAWIEPDNQRSIGLVLGAGLAPTGEVSEGANQFVRFF